MVLISLQGLDALERIQGQEWLAAFGRLAAQAAEEVGAASAEARDDAVDEREFAEFGIGHVSSVGRGRGGCEAAIGRSGRARPSDRCGRHQDKNPLDVDRGIIEALIHLTHCY